MRPRRAALASRPPGGLRKKARALQSLISMAPRRTPLPKVSSRPESRHISGLRATSPTRSSARKPLKPLSAAFGQIDILINNAGITQPVKFLDIKPSDWDRIQDVNLKGILFLSQAVIPHMQKRKAGSIACMSSVSAQRGGGIFGGPHYSAAKAGVLGLAKAMAREFGADGIRVNCVTPGLIGTDITSGKLTDEMRTKILEGIPLGQARRGQGRRGNLHVSRFGPIRLRHRRRDRRQRRDAHSLSAAKERNNG